MRNSSPKSKEMNIALDRLQYLSQAAPLEKQLTCRELQNRPLGFQTAMPREPIGEAMNSLEFKSMEGAMYENAAYAGQMMRSEQMKDVLPAEAAAVDSGGSVGEAMGRLMNVWHRALEHAAIAKERWVSEGD